MAEDIAAAPETADPAALSLALSGASREEADAFLRDQRHHLHEQLNQIHLDIWEKKLGVLLRLATLCVGLAVASGLSLLIWQAAHSDGLRVEAFSVPPAMAERGLTGQVVAARVIDRLGELQSQTNTSRPARSYSNAWGDKAIKLEIPEAGISLDELDSWLREKVGHETLLTGEVVRTETGVTLTARAGEGGAVRVSGPEADMDTLTGKLAEAIYRLTQPYRYAIYLMRHEGRAADALPIFRDLALHGAPEERRWSYGMWASAAESATGDHETGLFLYEQARDADPDAMQPLLPLSTDLYRFGRVEEALKIRKDYLAKLNSNGAAAGARLLAQSTLDMTMGDYRNGLLIIADLVRKGLPGLSRSALLGPQIENQTNLHELTAARASSAEYQIGVEADETRLGRYRMMISIALNDWRDVLAHQEEVATRLKSNPHNRNDVLVNLAMPLALAQAHMGDYAAAARSIAPSSIDCYPCLIARAQIAELAGQHARADLWFNRAREAGPSLPFAFEEQGKVFLERGQPGEAITQFTIAGQKSPHFADPLEGWGEALMAKNQSHLALAKFAEAEKYAPNWGRLHLKWGEALAFSGKPADAKAQFARAAQLDLTPSEKSELAKATAHG